MSTTAGVGAGADYVAVNIIAVWAMILGLGSSLALVDPYLLVIPLVAIVFSIVALRQITNSNGTQTGRWLAWFGMALAVGFASFVLSHMAAQARQDAADRQTIYGLVDSLGTDVKDGNYQGAIQLFSPTFRNRVDMPSFSSKLNMLRANPTYGTLKSIESNKVVQFFDSSTGDDIRQAQARLIIHSDKMEEPISPDVIFRRDEGRWYIDDIPALFAQPQQQQRR